MNKVSIKRHNNDVDNTNKRVKCPTSNQHQRFQHGNYNRYYGYRNADHEMDKRTTAFEKSWFENKSCLDIGCNVGHMTLWLAKHFHPATIKGVDIDPDLIKAAKKNIAHYLEQGIAASTATCVKGSTPSTRTSMKDNTSSPATCVKDITSEAKDPSKINENLSSNDSSEMNNTRTESSNKLEENSDIKCNDIICNSAEKPDGLTKTLCHASGKSNDEDKRFAESNDLVDAANKSSEISEKPSVQADENNSKFRHVCESKNDRINTNVASSELLMAVDDGDENLSVKQLLSNKKSEFPHNVTFVTESYVPASASILKYTKPLYDVILCLSVTKWIQLNNGDAGLKLMFQKIYKQLNEGGLFILEPQPYNSYKRRKNITPQIRKNYDSMELKPTDYIKYLLSEEVGFVSYEQSDIRHEKEGFHRPIYFLRK